MVYPKGKLPTGFIWGEDSGNGVNDRPDDDNTKPLPVLQPLQRRFTYILIYIYTCVHLYLYACINKSRAFPTHGPRLNVSRGHLLNFARQTDKITFTPFIFFYNTRRGLVL